ncbi:hypothetical protein WN48_05535 [Eufriesea mexicana]|uniref:Uncharacterized protein n=1 Tax=Eufriesea mexicana TaxID=516756 RepID=A0A310SKD8_9HYME|nr:hypothetical protein WN48_05535 [Eufriesea mexicana]
MFQFDDSARCLLKGLAFSLRCVTVETAGSVKLNVTPEEMKHEISESDICTFAARTEHFHIVNKPSTALFTSNTRPKALRELYEAAAIVAVRSLDSLRRDGSSMDMFLCTPVLGKRRRDQSLDIESRIPAAIEDLRRWTSTEALGDVTVPPDCMSRILGDTTTDDAVDHKLPSPEEQVQAVALKFPAEIVAVDVSGRGFERMSMRRRSLLSGPESQETAVKRRSRPRRPRGKRRNTIAGTDQKEIRQAIGGETTGEEAEETMSNIATRAHRSASTDILGSSKKDSSTEKKSHFNTLKAWGMSRLKLISPKSSQQSEQQETAASGTERSEQDQGQSRSAEETNIYEMVITRRRKDKSHERKPSSSSSSGKSTSSIPVSVPSTERQPSVKLRESAAQRRERRKGSSRDEPPHSSSGNWSASSESGRASIGSETTTTTHQPRSTTTASIGTSSTSLSHVRRFKGRDTSTSSSVTSEGTLTPDIIQDIAVIPFSDDGETSSVYSCDTEGYYTSFHVDSGLKTLREEDPVPQCPLMKSNDISSDPTSPVVENEYELFGRGSTSTTTSSAGTVCTALMAPPPPERKSSLTVVAMVHGSNQNGGESPDSGHNTSSSPVESASSPACTGRSCSEFEYSESSDLESCERIERIRLKTAINNSRIPSMCVITPPGSDDEHARDSDQASKIIDLQTGGSVLMSATVGTSKMEVINGQDKNLYATIQVLPSPTSEKPTVGQSQGAKINPLSGVLGKLRGVLPGRKQVLKSTVQEQTNADSGDYVTIADVRNNNDKRQDSAACSSTTPVRSPVTYANSDIFKKDAEYVSLSELPKKPDSSLERKRQGARVTLDSEGKVVYSSDSLKRRKGAHTTFNPGPFVREGVSPSPSPLLHRATPNVRAVTKTNDTVDGPTGKSTPPTSPQLGKVIIRAARSPDRAASPDYVRTPTTVVGPTSPTTPHRQVRGAYVNVQDDEGKTASGTSTDERDCTGCAGRLEAQCTLATNTRPNDKLNAPLTINGSPLLSAKSTCRTAAGTVALAPSNKLLDPNKSKLCSNKAIAENRSADVITCDENHPPELPSDIPIPQKDHRAVNMVDPPMSVLKLTNLRLDFEKSVLCPKNLRATGNTPKLSRKLLVSDLDTPNFCRKVTKLELRCEDQNVVSAKESENRVRNDEKSLCVATTVNEFRLIDRDAILDSEFAEVCVDNNPARKPDMFRGGSRIERKVKRSESYRMANSPIMFIKKFSCNGEKSSKICRTPSEELQEELLKERINYPETISSPEPPIDSDVNFDMNVTISIPITTAAKSPRPRATDIEPVRVLKYSGNDTEIW